MLKVKDAYCADSFGTFKNIDIIEGKEVSEFINNLTPKVIIFWKVDYFNPDFVKLLEVWQDICKFINITIQTCINDFQD